MMFPTISLLFSSVVFDIGNVIVVYALIILDVQANGIYNTEGVWEHCTCAKGFLLRPEQLAFFQESYDAYEFAT